VCIARQQDSPFSAGLFHSKIKAAVRSILPLLEDWSWTVQEVSLRTFAVFAENGVYVVDIFLIV
jgi:hypothetical protein